MCTISKSGGFESRVCDAVLYGQYTIWN